MQLFRLTIICRSLCGCPCLFAYRPPLPPHNLPPQFHHIHLNQSIHHHTPILRKQLHHSILIFSNLISLMSKLDPNLLCILIEPTIHFFFHMSNSLMVSIFPIIFYILIFNYKSLGQSYFLSFKFISKSIESGCPIFVV